MCFYIHIQQWACGCQVRPTHHFPTTFLKRCDEYQPSNDSQRCQTISRRPKLCDIPAQCPECHQQAFQNQFRVLYGLVGYNVDNIMSQLDCIDGSRELLNGADLHARNRLELSLEILGRQVSRCALQFIEARSIAVQSFLGPENAYHYQTHESYMDEQQLFLGPADSNSPVDSRSQLPDYDDADNSSAVPVPPVPSDLGMPAEALPSYESIFPHLDTTPFQPQDTAANVSALDEILSVSSDSHGQGMDRLEVLRRLERKLRSELRELEKSLLYPPVSLMRFTDEQRAKHDPNLGFGSIWQRNARIGQLHSHIESLQAIMNEEQMICNAYMQFLQTAQAAMRRTLDQLETPEGPTVPKQWQHLRTVIDSIYQNRWQQSLGVLLVPLNGTDPSQAHSLDLLPIQSAFTPRAMGFPQYVERQLLRYTALPEYGGQPLDIIPLDLEMQEADDVPHHDTNGPPPQALTEHNLRAAQGLPPVVERPSSNYRLHERQIIFSTIHRPTSNPEGYPEVFWKMLNGIPQIDIKLPPELRRHYQMDEVSRATPSAGQSTHTMNPREEIRFMLGRLNVFFKELSSIIGRTGFVLQELRDYLPVVSAAIDDLEAASNNLPDSNGDRPFLLLVVTAASAKRLIHRLEALELDDWATADVANIEAAYEGLEEMIYQEHLCRSPSILSMASVTPLVVVDAIRETIQQQIDHLDNRHTDDATRPRSGGEDPDQFYVDEINRHIRAAVDSTNGARIQHDLSSDSELDADLGDYPGSNTADVEVEPLSLPPSQIPRSHPRAVPPTVPASAAAIVAANTLLDLRNGTGSQPASGGGSTPTASLPSGVLATQDSRMSLSYILDNYTDRGSDSQGDRQWDILSEDMDEADGEDDWHGPR